MRRSFSFFVRPAFASYWWWYGTAILRGGCHRRETEARTQQIESPLQPSGGRVVFVFMTASLLCETVTGRTMAELLANRQAATSADMVELRLDGVADLNVEQALHGRRQPTIITVRPTWEGGRFDGSEETRRALLERALAAGAEYVDVEWQAGFADLIARAPGRVVV